MGIGAGLAMGRARTVDGRISIGQLSSAPLPPPATLFAHSRSDRASCLSSDRRTRRGRSGGTARRGSAREMTTRCCVSRGRA